MKQIKDRVCCWIRLPLIDVLNGGSTKLLEHAVVPCLVPCFDVKAREGGMIQAFVYKI